MIWTKSFGNGRNSSISMCMYVTCSMLYVVEGIREMKSISNHLFFQVQLSWPYKWVPSHWALQSLRQSLPSPCCPLWSLGSVLPSFLRADWQLQSLFCVTLTLCELGIAFLWDALAFHELHPCFPGASPADFSVGALSRSPKPLSIFTRTQHSSDQNRVGTQGRICHSGCGGHREGFHGNRRDQKPTLGAKSSCSSHCPSFWHWPFSLLMNIFPAAGHVYY